MAEQAAAALRRRRLYQDVIDRLAEMVRSGEIPVGSAFPSEKELALRYDVSRIVVREAFRVLEHAGLVRGKQGGKRYLISSAPSFTSLLTGFERVLQRDLLEARRALETSIIRLAAQRAKPEDLAPVVAAAQEAAKLTANNEAFRIKDMEIHLAFARMTGNAVLVRLQEYINDLRAGRKPFTMTDADRMAMASGHDALIDALRANDPDAAAKQLAAHLNVAQTVFEVSPEFKNNAL